MAINYHNFTEKRNIHLIINNNLIYFSEIWRALKYPTLYRKGSRSSDIKYEIRIKPSPSVSLLDLFTNKVQQPFDI